MRRGNKKLKFFPKIPIRYHMDLLKRVEENWTIIKGLTPSQQTKDICLAALRRNPSAIKYIHNQTDQFCSYSIRKDPNCVQFIKNLTPELCLSAVKLNPMVLEKIPEKFQTPEACLAAILKNQKSLQFVKIVDNRSIHFAISELQIKFNKLKILDSVKSLKVVG